MDVMRMQEMTEEDTKILRTGLRMLARMIARRHLAVKAAQSAVQCPEPENACVGADAAGPRGERS